MRAVVQRVHHASVTVDAQVCSSIGQGLLVYLGVDRDDGEHDVSYMVDKLRHMRIFEDSAGQMNLDITQGGGQMLIVSAFTVQADARRGRRPSFDLAAPSDRAAIWYGLVCESLRNNGVQIEKGSFGDHMAVEASNDGPICMLMDSRRLF